VKRVGSLRVSCEFPHRPRLDQAYKVLMHVIALNAKTVRVAPMATWVCARARETLLGSDAILSPPPPPSSFFVLPNGPFHTDKDLLVVRVCHEQNGHVHLRGRTDSLCREGRGRGARRGLRTKYTGNKRTPR
jgi:hypothetical protein